MLTPANDDEDPQVALVGEEGHKDQAVQVETFHQDPVVVGGQKIEEESHHHLAANLGAQGDACVRLVPKSKTWWLLFSCHQNPAVPHVLLAETCLSPGIFQPLPSHRTGIPCTQAKGLCGCGLRDHQDREELSRAKGGPSSPSPEQHSPDIGRSQAHLMAPKSPFPPMQHLPGGPVVLARAP